LASPSEARSIFARHTDKHGRLTFQIREGKEKESVVIPATAARLFKDILTQMSEGNAVTIMPLQVEITTPAGRRSSQRLQALPDWIARWRQNSLP
jgi:hypothetical protein